MQSISPSQTPRVSRSPSTRSRACSHCKIINPDNSDSFSSPCYKCFALDLKEINTSLFDQDDQKTENDSKIYRLLQDIDFFPPVNFDFDNLSEKTLSENEKINLIEEMKKMKEFNSKLITLNEQNMEINSRLIKKNKQLKQSNVNLIGENDKLSKENVIMQQKLNNFKINNLKDSKQQIEKFKSLTDSLSKEYEDQIIQLNEHLSVLKKENLYHLKTIESLKINQNDKGLLVSENPYLEQIISEVGFYKFRDQILLLEEEDKKVIMQSFESKNIFENFKKEILFFCKNYFSQITHEVCFCMKNQIENLKLKKKKYDRDLKKTEKVVLESNWPEIVANNVIEPLKKHIDDINKRIEILNNILQHK